VSDHQPIKSEGEPAARTFRYDEITVGMREARDYIITPEVYQGFLNTFHDHSPVHVDKNFARAQGFEGRVMHGTILNGFVSHFVGMYFPGRFSLLLSVDLRFSNPSYLGDSIHLEMVVSQKLDARNIVVMDATLSNITHKSLAARGRIQVMIKEPA
jgi:3-hydroxybutyryl-CoA dehydratase